MIDAATIERKIDMLTEAIKVLAQIQGARLNREQLCQRLGVHRNTLTKRLQDPTFPQPGPDGRWLLSDVIEWETRR